jgi:hypothetical protein
MRTCPSRSPKPEESDEVELARLYNCAATALNILYEASVAGRRGAKEALHDEADRLLRRAGDWRRARNSRTA